jgi:hypothetical protein
LVDTAMAHGFEPFRGTRVPDPLQGRVNRARRYGEQEVFSRSFFLANEMADEHLSRPTRSKL